MTTQQALSNDYRVNLDVFEGPLDLLVYLIRKNDLDVYDIPVAFLLEEYMRYLDTIKELDIDLVGEFLLMAAELAHIKSRMLLPEDQSVTEEEENDPRADLVKRLLEYQQYREVASQLDKRSLLGRDVFVPSPRAEIDEVPQGPLEATVYDLVEAFGKLLARTKSEHIHAVGVDRISVNECILALVERIKKGVTVTLASLLGESLTRYDLVVTFLALLEMSRLNMVKLYQTEQCGELYITGSLEEVHQNEVLRIVRGKEHHGTQGT